VTTNQFRKSFLPASFASIKDAFESLKQLPTPDIIFTHKRVDHHHDHRLLGELTWNTFRRHLVLEYEIPKYECVDTCRADGSWQSRSVEKALLNRATKI
jgi:LmbE family N-acetylglucosaminyl deacetylase